MKTWNVEKVNEQSTTAMCHNYTQYHGQTMTIHIHYCHLFIYNKEYHIECSHCICTVWYSSYNIYYYYIGTHTRKCVAVSCCWLSSFHTACNKIHCFASTLFSSFCLYILNNGNIIYKKKWWKKRRRETDRDQRKKGRRKFLFIKINGGDGKRWQRQQ